MIPFKSIENFYEECSTGIEFKYNENWYLIEFDNPFSGLGKVRIHLQDEDGDGYLDDTRCEEFSSLENLLHNYKIEKKTLAEIICEENGISKTILPVKRKPEQWQLDMFKQGDSNDKT